MARQGRVADVPEGTSYGVVPVQPGTNNSPPGCYIYIFESRCVLKKNTTQRVVFFMARQGLEPWTHALKGRCSTN